MEIFTQSYTVPPEGLSARHLFWMLQESAGDHSRLLGYGEDRMAALGVMWVVIRYYVNCTRWPRPGERLQVQTWPAAARHGFCPRFYQFLDGDGAPLLKASATWAVVDRESRRMVNPHERGVDIEPLVTGTETRLGAAIRRPVTDRERSFTVPEEYLDSNGHMNNTTYFDLAEDCLGLRAAERGLREVTADYVNEALCGETMTVRWGTDGDVCTVTGDADSGPVFRMLLRYFEQKNS